MGKEIKIAVIGLDTSHSVEFIRLMQAPDCDEELKISGMKAISCVRFETPFQNKEGLDNRQKQLESWGVKVTDSVDEALKGAEAIMLEINVPAYHLEYFKKVASTGMRIFVDKPLAGTLKDAEEICNLAEKNKLKVMSCSSLRFTRALLEAMKAVPEIKVMDVYGSMGKAPAGDSLIWYGVHTYEMLHRAMGFGAEKVTAKETANGVVAFVEYSNNRQAVVESLSGFGAYGGRLQAQSFVADMKWCYHDQMKKVSEFLHGGDPDGDLKDALEVTKLMVATRKSVSDGKTVSA